MNNNIKNLADIPAPTKEQELAAKMVDGMIEIVRTEKSDLELLKLGKKELYAAAEYIVMQTKFLRDAGIIQDDADLKVFSDAALNALTTACGFYLSAGAWQEYTMPGN